MGRRIGLSTVELFKNLKDDYGDGVYLEGELLRKYQLTILKIAADIIEVCEDNDINYHLCGGSALGAVRHKGFIPWDDDMDIDILSRDFDRFVELFQARFGDKYWIHTCTTPEYGMTVNRIRLKGSIFRGREDENNEECGFFVDIMRIENVFDNIFVRYIHGFMCLACGFLLSCRNFYKNKVLMRKLAGNDKKIRLIFETKIFIGSLLRFWNVTKWATITQKCYGLCKNTKSKYVNAPAGRYHFFGEMYKRDGFLNTTKVEFEGYSWNISKDYDGYLSHMYGNYMSMPPEEDREKHVLLELKFPNDVN